MGIIGVRRLACLITGNVSAFEGWWIRISDIYDRAVLFLMRGITIASGTSYVTGKASARPSPLQEQLQLAQVIYRNSCNWQKSFTGTVEGGTSSLQKQLQLADVVVLISLTLFETNSHHKLC
ncbi:hypothetical protein CDAR_319631 [Caerostris darwini]|uniref:Uncharacterized protein n=1 Tax=Caerostris darwini TaxID=1538125 RepID=A0AAV4M7D8_9ARAC|nr:hypothetical protein CDAR_319631 [Caerostris darwini]